MSKAIKTSKVSARDNEVVGEVRTRLLSMLNRRNDWAGTMTELGDILVSGKQPSTWPGSPSSLRRVINQIVPVVRRAGFKVEFIRSSDHTRTRIVTFSRRAVRAERTTSRA